MIYVFIQIFFMALAMSGLCSFIIITGRRCGFWDFLQLYTVSWLPWGCNYCLGFWLSVIFSILSFTLWVPFRVEYILVPIMATVYNYMQTK